MLIVSVIFSLYFDDIPWYILLAFGLDVMISIEGIISSLKKSSIFVFIYFISSLFLFLFNLIPLILLNSIVWNQNIKITYKDIFQSIFYVFWFFFQLVSMHFSRILRLLLEQEKMNRMAEKEVGGMDSCKVSPTIIISVDPLNEIVTDNGDNEFKEVDLGAVVSC
ncbi:hypothetical protein DLAC_09583 [Tieghemostelium lacteum]|uniref:Transmembrane protein n=1 Tax=Tieghemostelium lacteum TaxID=361077 RepID=A0A151Z6N3_TIELA|nr:hypothetical protein DLAC_09583 [Tieghemostelium lacteum]|eukprot:KYQ89620.1 hypothetical protein DLAC_09583 [Tieghemostelium lacteum]